MGLPPDCVALVLKEGEPVPRREAEFEIGRPRYDTQYSVAWRALFEMFVPIERVFGPAHRLLTPETALKAIRRLRNPLDVAEGETAWRGKPSPASAEEVGSLLRVYVGEIPDAVIRADCARPSVATTVRRSSNRWASCRE